jgi:hypothetical protein
MGFARLFMSASGGVRPVGGTDGEAAMAERGQVRVGTSGWNYGHWRGIFYPRGLAAGRWFSFYSRHFDTVEINNTFYRLPSAAVFAGWAEQAPAGFIYAIRPVAT